MPSPPKPWEVKNSSNVVAVAHPTTTSNNTSNNDTSTSTAPALPSRSTTTNATTPISLNRPGGYGNTSTLGGYNSYGGYASSYNRTGYGSGYGGYGGYSSGYGGYNSGYGGYSGYGSYSGYGGYGGYGGYNTMNRYGMNQRMGPYGPNEMSLTQRVEMGTRPTFEVIENIVGSFGGFAQMLDSTFMATHSSFMAMVGIAEQLGSLKNYLGQVFSVFAVYRLLKRLIQKLTGRLPPANPIEINFNEFQQFDKQTTARFSRKPILMFLFMVVGLPYLMHKLIKLIAANPKLQQPPVQENLAALDPSKLEFARATYDFNAESPMELTLKKGDIVAIISKVTDPASTAPSAWWRGRLRDGTMGLFPANYVEIIQKAKSSSDEPSNKFDTLKEEHA